MAKILERMHMLSLVIFLFYIVIILIIFIYVYIWPANFISCLQLTFSRLCKTPKALRSCKPAPSIASNSGPFLSSPKAVSRKPSNCYDYYSSFLASDKLQLAPKPENFSQKLCSKSPKLRHQNYLLSRLISHPRLPQRKEQPSNH